MLPPCLQLLQTLAAAPTLPPHYLHTLPSQVFFMAPQAFAWWRHLQATQQAHWQSCAVGAAHQFL